MVKIQSNQTWSETFEKIRSAQLQNAAEQYNDQCHKINTSKSILQNHTLGLLGQTTESYKCTIKITCDTLRDTHAIPEFHVQSKARNHIPQQSSQENNNDHTRTHGTTENSGEFIHVNQFAKTTCSRHASPRDAHSAKLHHMLNLRKTHMRQSYTKHA